MNEGETDSDRGTRRRWPRTRSGRTAAIAAAVLLVLGLVWNTGAFDHALVNVGLNRHDCFRNGFGATFCGDEVAEFRRKLGQALGGSQIPTVAGGSAQSSSDETTTDENSSQPADSVGVGHAVRDDGVTFKVQSIRPASVLPRTYESPIREGAHSQLVAVRLRWRNNTDRPIDPFCGGGSILLFDDRGRQFTPLDASYEIVGNKTCEDLQPGFGRWITLAFRIPTTAVVTGVALWNGAAAADPTGDSYVAVASP
jgi:hypothetical protein